MNFEGENLLMATRDLTPKFKELRDKNFSSSSSSSSSHQPDTNDAITLKIEQIDQSIKFLRSEIYNSRKLFSEYNLPMIVERPELESHVNHVTKNINDQFKQIAGLINSLENFLTSRLTSAQINLIKHSKENYKKVIVDLLSEFRRISEKTRYGHIDDSIFEMPSLTPPDSTYILQDQLQYNQKETEDYANQAKDILINVTELNQIFTDFSQLVDIQGELIDKIEFDIEQSVSNVDKGYVHLVNAKSHEDRTRKICSWFSCFIILLVLIGFVILIGFVKFIL